MVTVALIIVFAVSGCSTKVQDAVGEYQSTVIEGAVEYVDILVNGEVKRYVTRAEDKEHAAIPDFLTRGNTIGFSYKFDNQLDAFVITRFFAPQ